MSEQQCAFDNWQDAAEQISKTVTNDTTEQSTTKQEVEQKEQQKKPEQQKIALKQRINMFKNLTPEQFQAKYTQTNKELYQSNKNVKISGILLKNQKQFVDFANQVGDKLCQNIADNETLDQQSIVTFFQEILLCLYDGLTFSNFFQIQRKLKTIKNERKIQQKKIQKQIQKKKRNKAEQQSTITASSKATKKYEDNPKKEDDLFGGVTMINSKQQEQQRKKKAAQKKKQQQAAKKQQEKQVQKEKETKQAPPPPADDDDFM